MNSWRKSALFGKIIAVVGLLAVSACDTSDISMPTASIMPHVFSGNEVPSDVMAEPRVVVGPSPAMLQDKTYPLLGDVPSLPHNFSTQPMIEATKQQLSMDRDIGDAYRDEYEEPLQGKATTTVTTTTNSTARSGQP